MVCHVVPCRTMSLEKCLAQNVGRQLYLLKLKSKSCVIGHCTWLISAMDEHENSYVLRLRRCWTRMDVRTLSQTTVQVRYGCVCVKISYRIGSHKFSKHFVPVRSISFGFIHRERLVVWISKTSPYTCHETTRVTSVC